MDTLAIKYNSLPLPCLPYKPSLDSYKLCPIRIGDAPNCWGARCAAFRPLDAVQGVCLLIEGGAA